MKKLIKSLLMCGAMASVIAFTTGCSEDDGVVQVRIGMWPAAQLTQDIAMFNNWKTEFERDNPGYEIIADNYEYDPSTVVAKAQSKTLPTVFQTWFTEPEMLINSRYIRDITPQLNELGWLDKMDVKMKDILSRDGKTYGVPRDGYGLGMVMNLEQLEFYGILEDLDGDGKIDIHDEDGQPLYPTTFEELRQLSVDIDSASDGMVKGSLILSSNKNGGWQFSNIAWNFGAELQIKNSEGKYVGNLASDESVDALEYIQDLAQNDLLLDNTAVVYNDWTRFISGQVATAFVGNDVVANAVTQGGVDLDKIAFVPMPAGPDSQNALFGGTPYVFANNATDEEVMGALKFLEYMGRSPEDSDIAEEALEEGAQLSQAKSIPILPSIKPWTNDEYLTLTKSIEDKYVNVEMDYFKDFYDSIYTIRHDEEPYFTQAMYSLLDNCIQEVLDDPYSANAKTLLETANSQFNNQYMSNL